VVCGVGLIFSFIQEAIGPTGRRVGVDLTPAMLAEAGKRVAVHGRR
jgi:demethylmenaquinone methyltransferase/2-methoxy-6-polyprenyl-1,4-benzoquinol methylase